MKEDARKLIELHELLDSHEWKAVSYSFQVCACGMCRGSGDAYGQRSTINVSRRGRRWGTRTNTSVTQPTDWMKLSEVTTEHKWFLKKAPFIERIKDYLIQFPYWAGVYGNKTRSEELINVMKQDPNLLLQHACRIHDYSEENEAQLRDSVERIIAFLDNKKEHISAKHFMPVSSETRQSIFLNGTPYQVLRLAKIEGPKDDTLAKTMEGEAANLDDYMTDVLKKIHPAGLQLLLGQAAVPINSDARERLLNVTMHFNLFSNPVIKATMLRYVDSLGGWANAIKYHIEEEPVKVREFADVAKRCVELKNSDTLFTLVKDSLVPLTVENVETVVEYGYSGDKLPVVEQFDQALWNKMIELAQTKRMAKEYLQKWKRYLRTRWTRDIYRLEQETRNCKEQGVYDRAKATSKACAQIKAWAHGLLVQYKTVCGKED